MREDRLRLTLVGGLVADVERLMTWQVEPHVFTRSTTERQVERVNLTSFYSTIIRGKGRAVMVWHKNDYGYWENVDRIVSRCRAADA